MKKIALLMGLILCTSTSMLAQADSLTSDKSGLI